MTPERALFEGIRPFLADLEARVEARVAGASCGITEGSVSRRGDVWRQWTLEFLASGGGDLLWVMVYVKGEEPLLHAMAEFGREDRVLGEFAPASAAAAAPLAESVGAFLLGLEERLVLELAPTKA